MKTALSQNKDFLAGLLFIFVGGAALYIALAYPFGTVLRMGPGFFPRILALILISFGVITLVRGLRSGDKLQGKWGWFPLALLTAALVLFGWLMEHFGMLPALVALFITSAYAGHEFKIKEVLVLTVVMCVFATAVFVWGLGLPYPLVAFGK